MPFLIANNFEIYKSNRNAFKLDDVESVSVEKYIELTKLLKVKIFTYLQKNNNKTLLCNIESMQSNIDNRLK